MIWVQAIKIALHPINRDERHSFRGTTRNSPFPVQLKALLRSRSLTEPPGEPYSKRFRTQLVGESPVLHASGSHHPALSEKRKPIQGSPVTAVAHIPYILAYSAKICKNFFGCQSITPRRKTYRLSEGFSESSPRSDRRESPSAGNRRSAGKGYSSEKAAERLYR